MPYFFIISECRTVSKALEKSVEMITTKSFVNSRSVVCWKSSIQIVLDNQSLNHPREHRHHRYRPVVSRRRWLRHLRNRCDHSQLPLLWNMRRTERAVDEMGENA